MKRMALMLALLGGTTLLTVSGCGRKETAPEKAAAPRVTGVTIAAVAEERVPDTLEAVGTVRARTSAAVAARIPGTVSVLRVREGDRVKKGQLLAQLDARESLAGAAGAQAAIDEAGRALEEAKSRKLLADTTFERYRRLFEAQAVTRQEFDTKQTERDLAALGVARAEARLQQSREGGRAATAVADYTRIVAPIAGIVTARQADLGASVFPGQPLLTIEDEGSYQLELAVPESLAGRVRPGTPVQVTLDALAIALSAKVAEVVPAADPASRTFIVKIALGQKGLKSGMFGRGAMSLGTTTTGIMAPRQAIFERGALTAVWTVDQANTARMRLVKTGKTVGDRVEILSGLDAGERVVTVGVERVVDGARVE
ncbi:MAG TPA: efflux RND transporter periplasmic adaptor subunit [Geobacteraceae bacterium]